MRNQDARFDDRSRRNDHCPSFVFQSQLSGKFGRDLGEKFRLKLTQV